MRFAANPMRRLAALALAVTSLTLGPQLHADQSPRFGGAHRALPMQARRGVSLDQAIEMAERQFHARVVRAGVDESNGQRAYVLRLVSEQGRVWTVRVDAQTGSFH